MQKKDEHKLIKLLEFVLEKSGQPISPSEMMNASGMDTGEFDRFSNYIFTHPPSHVVESTKDNKLKLYLKPEILFQYLGFRHYKEVERSSNRAFWIAIAACLASIASTALVYYKFLTTP